MPTAEFCKKINAGKVSLSSQIGPKENAKTARMQKAFAARDAKISGYGDE